MSHAMRGGKSLTPTRLAVALAIAAACLVTYTLAPAQR
jgi:hypothetical protein